MNTHVQVEEVKGSVNPIAFAAATYKKPVKTLGILGIIKNISMPFTKVLKQLNLRKTHCGAASAVGCDGQPLELLLSKEQLNQDDVDVDFNLDRDATRGSAFKLDIDGSINDEEGNSVSCCPAAPFDHLTCVAGPIK